MPRMRRVRGLREAAPEILAEAFMKKLLLLGIGCLMSVGVWAAQQAASQDKEKKAETPPPAASSTTEASAASPASAAGKKENPLKPSPEVLASAKKVFGYDCAMCHGENGDGKGELVESMSLKMKDWKDPSALNGLSDGDIYDLIVKGKDKMVGEGDRLAPPKVWGLVLYVRTFAKKSS